MAPAVVTLQGTRQVVSVTQAAVVGVAVENGRLLWEFPRTGGRSGGILPISYGEAVIVSATAAGVVAIKPRFRDGVWMVEKAWETSAVEMYISHPVVVGDTLFGFSRRASGQLFALDARDGRVLWFGGPRFATNVRRRRAMAHMRFVSVSLAVLFVGGCTRLNDDCQWPTERSQALHLDEGPDAQHLLSDVRRAEELSIRFGDVRWAPGPARGRGRDEQCLYPLFEQIARRHGITMVNILHARELLSNRRLDPAVDVPVAVVSMLLMVYGAGRIHTRFVSRGELAAALVATALMSIMMACMTVGFGRLWEAAVEMIRVGIDHLSYRGLRLPWTRYLTERFIATAASFCLPSLVYHSIRRLSRSET